MRTTGNAAGLSSTMRMLMSELSTSTVTTPTGVLTSNVPFHVIR
jgi:hypothetical protein